MTESINCDILIIGGGIAGITASIRLMQLAKQSDKEINVIILEKANNIGAHIISGAVFEPTALQELLPDWQELNLPINNLVTKDIFALLTKKDILRLPTPSYMQNNGNYIISLGELCKSLANYAENMGVQIFTGFCAKQLLFEDNNIKGVKTGEFGLDKDGNQTENYQSDIDIIAKHTLLAEGAHGALSKQLINHFNLRHNKSPQTYGLGIKEIWEINPQNHRKGEVFHSIGWPLDNKTYGGSFMYHYDNNLVSLGFIVGLDYNNPYLDPYETLQTFKTHPKIAKTFANAKRISYGAKVLNEGGWQSIPTLSVPGASLIGCAGGFLNIAKIKGIHTAMKSAMIAAEEVFETINLQNQPYSLKNYEEKIKQSWLGKELYQVRNIRPVFRYGLFFGLCYAAFDTYIMRGKAPWTFKHQADYKSLQSAKKCNPYHYAKHDNKLTFNKIDSLYLSNINHREDQPCHLIIKDKAVPIHYNLAKYQSPETRYCPAGVYKIIEDIDGNKQLKIDSQNCLHCKACDIKDPLQNIEWIPPEGGSGCNYIKM